MGMKPSDIVGRITFYRLVQWRAAIKLEAVGLRHSSGRSVTKHAKEQLGIPRKTTREELIKELTQRIEAAKAEQEKALYEPPKEKTLPYPWCIGNPTLKDCLDAGYCRRNPNCGE